MSFMKLGRIGKARACTMPDHMARFIGAKPGDYIEIDKTAQGFLLKIADKKSAEWMAAYDRCAKRYHNTLRALAEN